VQTTGDQLSGKPFLAWAGQAGWHLIILTVIYTWQG